jgi:hypothetical protein
MSLHSIFGKDEEAQRCLKEILANACYQTAKKEDLFCREGLLDHRMVSSRIETRHREYVA